MLQVTSQSAVQKDLDAYTQAAESTRQRLARKLQERQAQQLPERLRNREALIAALAAKGGAHIPRVLCRLNLRIAYLGPSMSSGLDDSAASCVCIS